MDMTRKFKWVLSEVDRFDHCDHPVFEARTRQECYDEMLRRQDAIEENVKRRWVVSGLCLNDPRLQDSIDKERDVFRIERRINQKEYMQVLENISSTRLLKMMSAAERARHDFDNYESRGYYLYVILHTEIALYRRGVDIISHKNKGGIDHDEALALAMGVSGQQPLTRS